MLGASPERVWLVGVVGAHFEPGRPLSSTVRGTLWKVIDAVIFELKRLDVKVEKKAQSDELGAWWIDEAAFAIADRP